MESNGNVIEAVKPNGEHIDSEKKRQTEVPGEDGPATKRVKIEDGDEVVASKETAEAAEAVQAVETAETAEAEVKSLPKGTAPVKPE